MSKEYYEVNKKIVNQTFGKRKDLFDIEKFYNGLDTYLADNTNSEGVTYYDNIVPVMERFVKCKNLDEIKKEYFKIAVDLAFGKMKLPNTPDPIANFKKDSFMDRIFPQYSFVYDLTLKNQQFLNSNLGFSSRFDALGTKFDSNSYKSEANKAFIEQYAKEVVDSIEVKKKLNENIIKVFEDNKNPSNPNVSDDYKKAYHIYGLEELNEMASVHYNREKPGFFARIFRTKAAREYASEKEQIKRMAELVKSADDNPKNDYSHFLDRDKYNSHRGQYDKMIEDGKDYLENNSGADLLKETKNLVGEIIKAEFPYSISPDSLDKVLESTNNEFDAKIELAETSNSPTRLIDLNPTFENEFVFNDNTKHVNEEALNIEEEKIVDQEQVNEM